MQFFKIVKPYKGFAVGQVISVSAPSRFDDMNNGFGVPYTPEVKKDTPMKQQASKKTSKTAKQK